jgi:hypothetical protein
MLDAAERIDGRSVDTHLRVVDGWTIGGEQMAGRRNDQ